MTPPSNPSPAPTVSQTDPFRYGWRYVSRTGPDGRTALEQVPLTLEDVLHPQEGDFIVQNSLHRIECSYLANVCQSRPLGPPIVWLTADLIIDWGVAEVGNHGPDLALFVGLTEKPKLTDGTFHVAESGGHCVLVVEIVSPDTRENGVVHKVDHYFKVGVPLYVIVDTECKDGPRRLLGYRHTPAGYETVALDEQGRLLLEPLGMYLCLRDERLVCQDATTGKDLADYGQLLRKLEEANRHRVQQTLVLEEALTRAQKAEKLLREYEQARQEAERLAQ